MKLYYSPGACSLAAHIALEESGLAYETTRVDLRSHTFGSGSDYYTINPKGYVPVLEVGDGERLTEVGVILQYIADRKPGTLAPQFGTMERYRTMEWLNFIATELHKGLSPLWKPTTPDAYKATVLENVGRRFDYIVDRMGDRPYVSGERFGVVDAYLFTIVNWHNFLKFDIAKWPALVAFQERVAQRPAVANVLRAEHLVRTPAQKAA